MADEHQGLKDGLSSIVTSSPTGIPLKMASAGQYIMDRAKEAFAGVRKAMPERPPRAERRGDIKLPQQTRRDPRLKPRFGKSADRKSGR